MYINAIFVGDRTDITYQTGICFDCGSEESTKEFFDSLKPVEAALKEAPFIIDLHDEEGDILDSVGVSAEVYTSATGAPVFSEKVYELIDSEHWASVEKSAKDGE